MSEIPKFIYKEEDGETYAIINPEYEQKILKDKYELYLKQSHIPHYYWDINLENYQGNKESIGFKSVKYFIDNLQDEKLKHVNLYLHGTHSSQKTALAVNILKAGIKKGYRVRFVLAGDLIASLMKNQGFKNDPEIEGFIKDLKKADLLVIDDIFDPNKALLWKNSENKNMILSEWDTFLRGFLSSESRLILTSNFEPTVIKQYYGESLYELVDRNMVALQFTDTIKEYKKTKLSDVFKDLK